MVICKLLFVAAILFCGTTQAGCPFSQAKSESKTPRGHNKPFGHHAKAWRRIETVYEHPEPQDFYHNYVRASRPLVIKGGVANWPAIKKWTNVSYINAVGGDERSDVNWKNMYDYDRHHAIRVDMTMKEFTEKMNTHNLYMDATIMTGLHDDVYWPHSLGCMFFLKRLKQLAIMMNNGRSKSDVHIDVTDTYFMQATGRRLWLLAHPSNVTSIYSGHPDLVDHSGISILNQTHIDLEKHAEAGKLVIYAGYLHPGDIIYVPEGWYHQVVTNGSPNIAIVAFMNVLFCEYNSEGNGDINRVTSCINKVLQKKPKKLECNAFPKKDITITELLKTYKPRTREAFQGDFKGKGVENRVMKYAKKLDENSFLPAMAMTLTGMSPEALKSRRVLYQGLKEGVRFFCTAPGDGSEEAIANMIPAKLRKKLLYLSYLSVDKTSAADVAASIEGSLAALKTSYIDFVLLTAPYCLPDYKKGACTRDAFQPSWATAWKALEALQQQGKIRFLGVSDFSLVEIKQLQKDAKLPITIARARFDPYFRNLELRHFCRDNGIHFMGRSVLGGRWKEEQPNEPKNRDIFKEYFIQKAAYQYKISIHAAAYDYAVKKNVIVAPRVNDPLFVRVNIKAIDSESNEKIDFYYAVDELVPEDKDGLTRQYAAVSDFSRTTLRPLENSGDEQEEGEESPNEAKRKDTIHDDELTQARDKELEKAKQLSSGNHSEEVYTDEKDFEIFPSYMMGNEENAFSEQ